MSIRIAVVGDALLDRDVTGEVGRLAPDAPVPVVDHSSTAVRPGGAGLAAALVAAADGHEVRLITALASDDGARELGEALVQRGVEVCDLGLDGATPEKVRIGTDDRVLLRLDRGGAPGRIGALTAAGRAAIAWADAVLVADYGRGVASADDVREALVVAATRGAPVVWDPHPRGPAPVAGTLLATPNDDEARRLVGGDGRAADGPHGALARAEALRDLWAVEWAAVTCGAAGAVACGPAGTPIAVTPPRTAHGDPCGAGDRFASRAAELLATGAEVPEALRGAVVAATDFVARGGALGAGDGAVGGEPADDEVPADAFGLVERTRAAGGTVVATGGCFDLLHPGHVRTLRAARALGDCLVVCLNSDASVRRLKGPRRPVVPQADRAAVLDALGCVDAVAIFDEDTPIDILRTLRPDVWVKGGDYTADELPETPVLREWGGRAVVLPFLEGRSTTRLIEEASLHAI